MKAVSDRFVVSVYADRKFRSKHGSMGVKTMIWEIDAFLQQRTGWRVKNEFPLTPNGKKEQQKAAEAIEKALKGTKWEGHVYVETSRIFSLML